MKKTVFTAAAAMFTAAAVTTGTSYVLEKRGIDETAPVIAIVSETSAVTSAQSVTEAVTSALTTKKAEEPLLPHSVNINTASAQELMRLEGIGEKTADKIIEYRSETPFETVEDIMNVSGIGEKKFADIEEYICVR